MSIAEIGAYIVGVGGAVAILTSRVKSDNLKDLKERVEILEKERESARQQHIENQKAIANLEGQLATYREIPLKSIANSLEALPKIVESNSQILRTLKGSAKIRKDEKQSEADDGGLLVQTKEKNPLDVKPVEEK